MNNAYKHGYNNGFIDAKKGDLRVWWIPQVPMGPFYWPVENVFEAKVILDMLAQYDLWQYDRNIKKDYCNAGGLEILEDDGDGELEWCEWYHPETGQDLDEWHQEATKQVDVSHD